VEKVAFGTGWKSGVWKWAEKEKWRLVKGVQRRGRVAGERRTYERAYGNASCDGGDGGGADVAGDAAAGGERGEDEGDVVEGSLGRGTASDLWNVGVGGKSYHC